MALRTGVTPHYIKRASNVARFYKAALVFNLLTALRGALNLQRTLYWPTSRPHMRGVTRKLIFWILRTCKANYTDFSEGTLLFISYTKIPHVFGYRISYR